MSEDLPIEKDGSGSLSTENFSSKQLSHAELAEFFQESIKHLVSIDPLVKDLHPQVTLDEVEAILALEHGQAITVYIERGSQQPWKVVVSRDATLHQLKIALKHHVSLSLARQKNLKKISWKYIWRTYWLYFKETKLTDDNKKLIHYGISNKSKLVFTKKFSKER